MMKQFLAGAVALALASGITSSAMASDQGGRSHAKKMHAKRLAGARGIDSFRRGGWDGQRFVGVGAGYPYGDGFDIGLGGSSPYCWPYDYTYPSGYSYCGASYIVSW